MEEVKNFRQHHSMTPGHPEFPNSEHNTPGIEATTGPLGQGVVNAAGIAAAQKMEQAMFNTKDATVSLDSHQHPSMFSHSLECSTLQGVYDCARPLSVASLPSCSDLLTSSWQQVVYLLPVFEDDVAFCTCF